MVSSQGCGWLAGRGAVKRRFPSKSSLTTNLVMQAQREGRLSIRCGRLTVLSAAIEIVAHTVYKFEEWQRLLSSERILWVVNSKHARPRLHLDCVLAAFFAPFDARQSRLCRDHWSAQAVLCSTWCKWDSPLKRWPSRMQPVSRYIYDRPQCVKTQLVDWLLLLYQSTLSYMCPPESYNESERSAAQP